MTQAELARLQNALLLSRAAYDFQLIPTGPGWSAPEYILDHGFAISRDQILYVYFRGTVDVYDWLTDIEAAPNQYGIHSGIYDLYAALQPAMVEAMSPFPTMPIEFGGHSLGGGLASIAAASTPGASSVTFAAPRVFTAAREQSLQQSGIRVANDRDIVPHLPGRLGLWSYQHRAHAYRFSGSSFEFGAAHSLTGSYAPSVNGNLQGPMDLA